MSNVNNQQKTKKYSNTEKRRGMSNHLNEEFGPESHFDAKQFKNEGKFSSKESSKDSSKDRPKSERTAWN